MKIVVFGASSKSGLEVVKQGVAAGHAVTAFVRDPAKLATPAAGVTVVKGDATDAAAIACCHRRPGGCHQPDRAYQGWTQERGHRGYPQHAGRHETARRAAPGGRVGGRHPCAGR